MFDVRTRPRRTAAIPQSNVILDGCVDIGLAGHALQLNAQHVIKLALPATAVKPL